MARGCIPDALTFAELHTAVETVEKLGGVKPAAEALGWPTNKVQHRINTARKEGMFGPSRVKKTYRHHGSPWKRHLFIPDAQVKPGVPLDHIDWIAQAIVDYEPDVIVVAGDWWDFPSLNSHEEPGSAALEGQRFQNDLDAGNLAFKRLCEPMEKVQEKSNWKPRKIFLCGNHEDRADRVAQSDPKWLGHVSSNACQVRDFEWHPFLRRVWVDGVVYSHFFQNTHSKHPIGGSVDNRLNKVGASFVQGHEQGFRYGTRITASGHTWHGIVAGSCLTPDHKILTSDLSYVPLGEIVAGQQIVSFDELTGGGGKRSRRYKTGTVEAVARDWADCFEVTLASGKVFKVTGDHLWLVRSRGTTTAWLRTDQLVVRRGGGGASHVPILMDEWECGHTFDHGWLSGLFDGEGCLYERKTTGGHCLQLSLSQKPGIVLDYAKTILSELLGVQGYTESAVDKSASTLRISGGRRNSAKVLGALRPIRLLGKFRPESLGRISINRWDAIAGIRAIGRREIVRIAVDAKTMIVEGYGHHNCYLHIEEYRGHQGQGHWRGIVVLNEVKDGDFCVMPLTLNYLCRKYEKKPLVEFMQVKYPDGDWTHL